MTGADFSCPWMGRRPIQNTPSKVTPTCDPCHSERSPRRPAKNLLSAPTMMLYCHEELSPLRIASLLRFWRGRARQEWRREQAVHGLTRRRLGREGLSLLLASPDPGGLGARLLPQRRGKQPATALLRLHILLRQPRKKSGKLAGVARTPLNGHSQENLESVSVLL
jgi:hypothetical protein